MTFKNSYFHDKWLSHLRALRNLDWDLWKSLVVGLTKIQYISRKNSSNPKYFVGHCRISFQLTQKWFAHALGLQYHSNDSQPR